MIIKIQNQSGKTTFLCFECHCLVVGALFSCFLMGVDGWCILTRSMSAISQKSLWHNGAVKMQKVQPS